MSENVPPNSTWLGIDLGTTNTVAAVFRGGNPGSVEVIFVVESNSTLTDSMVYFDADSDVVLVGKQAANEKANHPDNTICDAKRIMGLAYGNDAVREFQHKYTHFNIVNSSTGFAAFQFRHESRQMRQTPLDIATKVLQKIRETADEWANGSMQFEKAVITVPANFGQEQLVSTIRAGKEAGFSEVHLTKEPNAAAFFYGFKQQRLDGYKILVLDFGGGTLDVSILKVQIGEFEVLAMRGRKWLGGRDLDNIIREEMVKRIKAKFDYDCADCQNCIHCEPGNCRVPRDMQLLLERCERLKINLSSREKSNISPDFIGRRGQIDMTRAEYEELAMPIFTKVIETVLEAMDDVQFSADDIDEVELTGGSSCTPILMEMLQSDVGFPEGKIKKLEPMHAVAKGAAIIGAQLDDHTKSQLPTMILTEICPLSIGTETCENLFAPLIRRGTKIPCLAEDDFYTVYNDQRSMTFGIYEGERKLARENNRLGTFTIYDLSKGAAGNVSAKLKLSIDRDGILHTQATHKESIAVMDANYKEKRVDSGKVESMIRDAETHLLSDSREAKRINKKFDLIKAIEHAKYKCTDSRILNICTIYEEWLTRNPSAIVDQFDSKLKEFHALLG